MKLENQSPMSQQHSHHKPKFIAIGITPLGVISIGLVPMGVVSIGAAPMGVFSFGAVAMGVFSAGLVSMGTITAGLQSMGLVSIGPMGMGNTRVPIGIQQSQPEPSEPMSGEEMIEPEHRHHQ